MRSSVCFTVFLLIIIKNFVYCEENEKSSKNKPLLLTPFIRENLTDLARNLSKVNIDGFENLVSYSGYFTVNNAYHSNLFFWFIQSENDYLNDPVLLWLHGGPGLPSEAGLFGESGPLTVKNGTFVHREYSWTQNHSIIYIDNPVGTGFSFTDDGGYAENQDQVGLELYKALLQFFTLFSELQQNDFYLTGGSYAGKYIPAVGHYIHTYNPTGKLFINLKGFIIYSGIVDPINQVDYSDYLYDRHLIDCPEKGKLDVITELVKKYIKLDIHETATILWNVLVEEIKENPKISNRYNYLRNDDYYTKIPEWVDYIQQPEIRKKLHVGDTFFNFDITKPNLVRDYLGFDWTKSVAPWFEELVNNYPCLIFGGDLDVMIPYTSVFKYLQQANFTSHDEFINAETYIWRVDEDIAGECKSAEFLTECVVKDSGHSVPHEKPKYCFDLVYKFIRNLSLRDKEIDNNIISDNHI